MLGIVHVEPKDAKQVLRLYSAVVKDLRGKEIYQWDRFYPNGFIIRQDIKVGNVFGMKQENEFAGVIVLNTDQSGKYKEVSWKYTEGKPLCIHRLAVHPNYQGKGIGKKLLQFAETYALENGYSSIRLDVFTQNPTAVGMYERTGYEGRGTIKYPFRKDPYLCMEKKMKQTS